MRNAKVCRRVDVNLKSKCMKFCLKLVDFETLREEEAFNCLYHNFLLNNNVYNDTMFTKYVATNPSQTQCVPKVNWGERSY